MRELAAHPQANNHNEGAHDLLLRFSPKELHVAREVLCHNVILQGVAGCAGGWRVLVVVNLLQRSKLLPVWYSSTFYKHNEEGTLVIATINGQEAQTKRGLEKLTLAPAFPC